MTQSQLQPSKFPMASQVFKGAHTKFINLGQDYMQHRWGFRRNDGNIIRCEENDSLTLLLGNINSSLIIVKDLAITGPLVRYH